MTGARAPLFDRLVELDEEQSPSMSPRRVLDLHAFRNSIAKELNLLLNTRSHTKRPFSRTTASTVLDYGLPDFSPVSAVSDFERAQMAQQITEQIQRFEPRLEQVRIRLSFDANHPRSAIGSIEAVLRVESLAEPVSFPLLVDRITGQTHIESR